MDKVALISSVSRSYYNSPSVLIRLLIIIIIIIIVVIVIIIIIIEFSSEGQAGEAWESSKIATVFRQSAALEREIDEICLKYSRYFPTIFVDPCIIVQFIQKNPTRCNSVSKFIIPYLYKAQHVSGETPPIIRRLKLH
jgi:preprotein translocase subunit SecG